MNNLADLTDVQWIAEVRKYALQFGHYTFSHAESKRMQPFIGPDMPFYSNLTAAVDLRLSWRIQLPGVFDLMDAVERGIAAAVAAKLTQ